MTTQTELSPKEVKEIENLMNHAWRNVTRAKGYFRSILASIKSLKRLKGWEYIIQKYEDEWKEFERRFNCALSDSRKLALSKAASARRYANVIIPLIFDESTPPASLETKSKHLQNFIQEASYIDLECEEMSKQFDDIMGNIQTFAETFEKKLDRFEGQEYLIHEDIEKMKESLEKLGEWRSNRWILLGCLSLGLIGGAVVCYPAVVPFASLIGAGIGPVTPEILAVGIRGVGLGSFLGSVYLVEGGLNIQNERNGIADMETGLEQLLNWDMKPMINAGEIMGGLSSTWLKIYASAVSVSGQLKRIEKSGIEKTLEGDVNEIKLACRSLEKHLKEYASRVY